MSMKKPLLNVDNVKTKISSIQGRNVKMKVNRGRKRFETFNAVIKDVYPSVFTVNVVENSLKPNLQSFAYTEIVCGNVRICLEK